MPIRHSSTKSLPPLPVVAPHAGTSSDAALLASNGDASGTNGTARSRVTPACIRATITLVVFGAYLIWALPWHLKHGWDGIPWIGGGGHTAISVSISNEDGGLGIETTSVEADGILRAPKLGVPKDVQRMWGQYSPWRAAGTYVGPPEGCNVTQVSLCTVRSLCAVDLRCAFHSVRWAGVRCVQGAWWANTLPGGTGVQ